MFNKVKLPDEFLKLPIREDIGDVIEYTNAIFDSALEFKASDIHIEPSRDFVGLRFRESGDFIFIDRISPQEYAKLIARLKILSNLRIDEKQKPQDGKIGYMSVKFDEFIDIRVSILPVVDGEKVVMRILRQDTSLLSLEKINFLDSNLEKVKTALASRYGMILVAGPTGSGKSTTLFSMLKSFNPLENNISTLEDPVEYNIPYINQTQVKPQIGFDFAAGLRSLVRQDPDIIMVGEIRDKETAMLAIEAALTGHLVLSTIHTNSAAGTIQRLINMGVEPFLISSALKLVVSQRLVKRLHSDCMRQERISDPLLLEKIGGFLSGVVEEDVGDIGFFQKGGCPICDHTGYKGRVGVHEVMPIVDSLSPFILGKASVQEIENQAKLNGMLTIIQDGLIKSATGKTSPAEALTLL